MANSGICTQLITYCIDAPNGDNPKLAHRADDQPQIVLITSSQNWCPYDPSKKVVLSDSAAGEVTGAEPRRVSFQFPRSPDSTVSLFCPVIFERT